MKPLLRPFVTLLLALALLPILTGCASLWTKKPPPLTVSLADMELQGIKGLETIFRLQLRVINADEEPLELRGLTCALKINGKAFATGISDEHVTVPADGTATVPVLVYAGMFDMVGPVIELIQRSSQPTEADAAALEYELTGTIRLGTRGEGKAPFSLRGSMPPGKQNG